MHCLARLRSNDRHRAARVTMARAEFSSSGWRQQAPQSLRTGCSDSRVAVREIVDLLRERFSSTDTSPPGWWSTLTSTQKGERCQAALGRLGETISPSPRRVCLFLDP